MKITAVRPLVVDAFRANYVFVVIETSDAISGVGEATVEHSEPAVAAQIEEYARGLIGADPFAVEHHIEMLSRNSYWRTGVTIRSALAGIEAALLDIKGKALGVPVYELLGGKQRDRVPAYANGWFVGAREPGEFAEKAVAAVELGFKALKWDPFGSAYLSIERSERNRTPAHERRRATADNRESPGGARSCRTRRRIDDRRSRTIQRSHRNLACARTCAVPPLLVRGTDPARVHSSPS